MWLDLLYFYLSLFFKRFLFIYLFIHSFILERGEGKESEGGSVDVWEKHWSVAYCMTWPTSQARALTGNRTGNLLVCRRHPAHSATPVRTIPLFSFCYSKNLFKVVFRWQKAKTIVTGLLSTYWVIFSNGEIRF